MFHIILPVRASSLLTALELPKSILVTLNNKLVEARYSLLFPTIGFEIIPYYQV